MTQAICHGGNLWGETMAAVFGVLAYVVLVVGVLGGLLKAIVARDRRNEAGRNIIMGVVGFVVLSLAAGLAA